MSDVPAFEARYRVRFDEAGPDGLLRSSGFLRYAQDLAWQHSEARGFDRAWYAERGLNWVVRAADVEISEAPRMGQTAVLSTTVAGYRRIWARRLVEVHLDGRLAARLNVDWVLLDERGRAVRIPEIFGIAFPGATEAIELLRLPLPATPAEAARLELSVRPQELDPLGHVNNAVYLDWFDEGRDSGREDPAPLAASRRVRLEYLASATLAERIVVETWRDRSSGSVLGRIRRAADGGELVRLRADWGQSGPAPR